MALVRGIGDKIDFKILWILSGFIILAFFYFLPAQKLLRVSPFLYFLSLSLLVLVIFMGKKVSGSASWLQIGKFQFQPSEFAKLATILILANFLSRKNVRSDSPITLIVAGILTFIPLFLTILQPDLGTAVVFGAIFLGIMFWFEIPVFWLFILMTHQQKRISSFLNPLSDPLGAGYNVIQSKIAIGSGGLVGKGFMKGTQTQLRFIPAQWTDFIFCVPAEEFGFIGSVIILLLYLILLWRVINLASTIRQKFASLVAIGIFSTNLPSASTIIKRYPFPPFIMDS